MTKKERMQLTGTKEGRNLEITDRNFWKSERNFGTFCSAPQFSCFHSGPLQTFPRALLLPQKLYKLSLSHIPHLILASWFTWLQFLGNKHHMSLYLVPWWCQQQQNKILHIYSILMFRKSKVSLIAGFVCLNFAKWASDFFCLCFSQLV